MPSSALTFALHHIHGGHCDDVHHAFFNRLRPDQSRPHGHSNPITLGGDRNPNRLVGAGRKHQARDRICRFWRYVGFNTVLYLAALQTIPKDLYEAATMDGANAWKQFAYITLPSLKPMIFSASH